MRSAPLLALVLLTAFVGGAGLGYVLGGRSSTARWQDAIAEAAEAAGLDAHLLRALVEVESGGRPDVVSCPTGPECLRGLRAAIRALRGRPGSALHWGEPSWDPV